MDSFSDDEGPPPMETKHAARISENDKDKLLASGDEREEYTDIFEAPVTNGYGSSIVNNVDFEDGESISASDEEVTGYTGDVEVYTESEIDQKPQPSVVEGNLISIQDGDDCDVNDETIRKSSTSSHEKSDSMTKSVTNESISEIADRLAEAELVTETPKDVLVPGSAVKVVVDSTGGYSSSGETSQKDRQTALNDSRHKKFRKHTSSFTTENNQEVLTSSGEFQQPAIHEEQKRRHKKKTTPSKQDAPPPREEKLIEVETPPTTPHHNATEDLSVETEKPKSKLPTRTIPIPGFKPLAEKPKPSEKKTGSSGSQKKRKRTRHKVYLDDPDVHQLISDHVMLLQKYLEDVATGRTQKRDLKPVSSVPPPVMPKESPQLQSKIKMPIAGAANINNTTPQHQNYHQPSLPHHHGTNHHPNQNSTYGGGSQFPHGANPIPHGGSQVHHGGSRHQYPPGSDLNPYQNSPYSSHHQHGGHHGGRGKDIIARIQHNDPDMSTSSEDDDSYGKQGIAGGKGYQKVNTGAPSHPSYHHQGGARCEGGGHPHEMCPECGDYHPDTSNVREMDDICPDCGVQHNPYEHGPTNAYQDPSDEARPEALPSVEGPHTENDLNSGVRYKMKYLGSCQITTQHPVTKETRMQQAQDAYKRIKNEGDDDDEDDDDVSTNVDMFISLERIKIINKDTKFEDVMMDHALRTVCFICDMGKILVLMARRLTSDGVTDFNIEQGQPITLGNITGGREKKTSKNICHVFEAEIEASQIAKAIGQAFNMAYRQFLTTNGISHDHVEEAEYGNVLESQKLVGQDLDRLTDNSQARDIVVQKRRGDPLGIMLLESGWGSMLPTVFIAHLANYSAAARSQRLTVGDHILTCNGASFVGLPLSECNEILRNTRSTERVIFRVVSCPPVVDVVVSRPDTKYQLGFSVQNGTICSLLRGGIAERGGVRVGHRIIEINGDSVVAKSHQYIVDILANTIGSISMKTMPVAMYRLMVGDDQPLHV
ncbi:uncharacterized protein [Clytia hemisphaerica]|uniref:uncharacterized protein isoform X2 n=1 Tax=Clytia hemisphaerica TaxID=252671 RepID=UPI0034D65D5C